MTAFSPATSVSSVIIITPVFYTHPHLNTALTRRTKGRSLGNFQTQCFFGYRGAVAAKVAPHFCYSVVAQIQATATLPDYQSNQARARDFTTVNAEAHIPLTSVVASVGFVKSGTQTAYVFPY